MDNVKCREAPHTNARRAAVSVSLGAIAGVSPASVIGADSQVPNCLGAADYRCIAAVRFSASASCTSTNWRKNGWRAGGSGGGGCRYRHAMTKRRECVCDTKTRRGAMQNKKPPVLYNVHAAGTKTNANIFEFRGVEILGVGANHKRRK